jgi:hypothetical protein
MYLVLLIYEVLGALTGFIMWELYLCCTDALVLWMFFNSTSPAYTVKESEYLSILITSGMSWFISLDSSLDKGIGEGVLVSINSFFSSSLDIILLLLKGCIMKGDKDQSSNNEELLFWIF